MAALPFTLYSNALLEIGSAEVNLASDSFFMVLATASYIPAPNSDATYANVSPGEVPSGAGYTVGGIALAAVTWTLSGAICTLGFNAAQWPSFSASLRYGVIIRCASGIALQPTDLLLCYSDLGGGNTIAGSGATFIVAPGPSGAFQLSHSP